MNKDEIGIGILDIYTQADLDNCFNSIPSVYKNKKNLLVVSDTKNTLDYPVYKPSLGIQMASLRNWIIGQFRINKIKHIFLINSNQIIKDENIFENVIKKAEVFGTWFITGPEKVAVTLEDDDFKESLTLSNQLNSDFIYVYSGIVNNIGYFDERFFNTKELDVFDYILRLREKKIYPSHNFYTTISDGIESSNSEIQKNNYTDQLSNDKPTQMSYGYFFFRHKYIPKQNEPESVSQEALIQEMENIQTQYGKKKE